MRVTNLSRDTIRTINIYIASSFVFDEGVIICSILYRELLCSSSRDKYLPKLDVDTTAAGCFTFVALYSRCTSTRFIWLNTTTAAVLAAAGLGRVITADRFTVIHTPIIEHLKLKTFLF